MSKGHAITLYLSGEVHTALEKERKKRELNSKAITIARILEDYFRRKGMLIEEEV